MGPGHADFLKCIDKKTFRELRNELSRSMQDELQGSIPKIVASITERTRIDESKRRPPEDTSGAKRPKTRARSPEPQTGPPCPNFRKGKCEGGRSCYYSHNDDRRRNDDPTDETTPRNKEGLARGGRAEDAASAAGVNTGTPNRGARQHGQPSCHPIAPKYEPEGLATPKTPSPRQVARTIQVVMTS